MRSRSTTLVFAVLSAALAAVPDEAPVLVFTHNPDLFPEIPERVSLTIAGHTHGGQVYLPGIGRPIVPSRYGERFAIGHVVERGRHLFVSSGLGTSILPVRFLVPPEVAAIIWPNVGHCAVNLVTIALTSMLIHPFFQTAIKLFFHH